MEGTLRSPCGRQPIGQGRRRGRSTDDDGDYIDDNDDYIDDDGDGDDDDNLDWTVHVIDKCNWCKKDCQLHLLKNMISISHFCCHWEAESNVDHYIHVLLCLPMSGPLSSLP